jgi:serine/threonine protein phosphatase PrpC
MDPKETMDRGPLNLGPLATTLIDAANAGGGPDNITVILVQVK